MEWLQVPGKEMHPQGYDSRTEDSARTAYEELMAEENQAAARAAAKRAKKLKQKAKKHQAATALTAEAAAHQDLEEEQDYDQFRLPQSASDTAFGASAELEAAFQRPAAPHAAVHVPPALPQRRHVLQTLHPGTEMHTVAAVRAACSTDEADGAETYRLPSPTSNRAHVGQCEATEPAEIVQDGGGISSDSKQGGPTAGAQNLDSDAQFLQALFCCPITKVTICTWKSVSALKFATSHAQPATSLLPVCGSFFGLNMVSMLPKTWLFAISSGEVCTVCKHGCAQVSECRRP